MIAKILSPFMGGELIHKIVYQLEKIEEGVARELYNSSGDFLHEMVANMTLVASLNDRVKLPYIEFIISSPIGEVLPDSRFVEIAKEYMREMGYENSCYSIIKNDDKDHKHVHVLATTIDFDGIRINDSLSKVRSGKIMRKLEKEYGLQIMEKGKSAHKKTLGESQYRQYFFDTALHKALRSHNANTRVNSILNQSETYKIINPNLERSYTNAEWKVLLGEDIYEKMLEVLSDGKFFNPLLKDELLSVMDRIYPQCKNAKEFRDKLEKENCYSRLVSDKGKSYYVYGIPERGFYVKDTSLPELYRFGKIKFAGEKMVPDEQKHYLYNKLFAVLNKSSNYDEFRSQLADNNISMIEQINKSGIYGLTFSLTNIDSPEVFKSSDISKRLTYKNIQEYFRKESNQEVPKDKNIFSPVGTPIKPVVVCYINTRQEWEKDLTYMSPLAMMLSVIPLENESKKRRKEDDEFPIRKKKKNKGLSI